MSCIAEGPDIGRIILSYEEEPYFMPPDCDFLVWYKRWTDEFIAGMSMSQFADRYAGTQAELRALFSEYEGDVSEQRQLLLSLDRFPELEPDTSLFFIDLLTNSEHADNVAYKLFERHELQGRHYIINLLRHEDGERRKKGEQFLVWLAQSDWDAADWNKLFNDPLLMEDAAARCRATGILANWYREDIDTVKFRINERKGLPNITLEARLKRNEILAVRFAEMIG